MVRTIGVGVQGYGRVRERGCLYVDKTSFVRDWWASGDDVTLICRPRRFGKTLNLDTVRGARKQIRDRHYVGGLVERGIDESRIRTYGIAFRGREVLVG